MSSILTVYVYDLDTVVGATMVMKTKHVKALRNRHFSSVTTTHPGITFPRLELPGDGVSPSRPGVGRQRELEGQPNIKV